MNDQAATISHAKHSLIDLAIRFSPRLLTAVLILVVGVIVAVKPWVAVQDQVQATGEIYAAVLAALRARGVVMPPPQREVRLIGQPA